MGFFSSLKEKIPLFNMFGNKGPKKSQVELQFDRAMNLFENASSEEAVETLEKVVDTGIVDPTYTQISIDSLKILGEFYEKGTYRNAHIDKDEGKAAQYYEKCVNLTKDGDMTYKVAKMYLDVQNFSKAITHFEKAAERGIKASYMNLGSIYENGLSRIDQYGNKSEFVVPVDYDKAMIWYKKLADMGDEKAKAAYDRVEYASTHTDSLEFEEKDRLYTDKAEQRRAKGKEPR